MEQAQEVLERFIAGQRAAGKKPFVPAELQLAAIYLTRGNSQQAYPLYREALSGNPENIDAWKGLLSTLHSTGHDQEALAQVQQIPAPVRKTLEGDPAYLQTVGSIYAGLGQPQAAMQFLNRIQQHYAAERTVAPADVDIQNAWLLFNSQSDAALYHALMGLGSRPDLSDEQRRTVQTIWATWALRRSNQAAQAGNSRRALAILNAAAQAFPDNAAVTKALASGYAAAGLPKQAVAIFKAQDLSTGTAADYKAAIGAALADNDLKDAEVWLRFGLDQYPRDAQMLVLGAKFEQARGDANRAAEYYKASLAALPPVDYGADLASEMSRAAPVSTARRTNAVRAQDLATLLSAPEAKTTAPEEAAPAPVNTRPYLPGSTNTTIAPVPLNGPPVPATSGVPVYSVPPGYPGAPDLGEQPQPAPPKKGTKLKDYVPESKVEPALMDNAIHLHPVAAIEKAFGPYASYDPSIETAAMARARSEAPKVSTGLHAVVYRQEQSQQPVYPQPVYPQPAYQPPPYQPPAIQQPAYQPPANQQGTYKQSFPVSHNGSGKQSTTAPQSTTPDGTPVVPYAATARPAASPKHKLTPSEAARARAAAIRANQDSAPLTLSGVSHPPDENYDASQLDGVQFNPAQTQGTQVQRPQSQQSTDALPASSQQPVQTGDSNGQQYPQPNTRGTQAARPRRRAAPTQTAPEQAPVQQSAPPITYPPYPQPALTNPGPPPAGQAYPLPEPPSDSDLIQHNVPPLRGYYDPRVDPKAPLSQRQQTELDLAVIEGSYSGWIGGTAYGRYRSGTPGLDRLTALEAPFEVSGVASKTARFSIIPKGVFLNSGVLNTQGGGLGTQPVLGTLPGNALNPPQQQFATGVGGEIQMTTRTLGLALGYTPYGFLVSNVIGRARWKPGNGHFTLFGGRDAVKETQLSYAGLRDPGSATFGGNIWGGVVESGGGVRFDFGDEKSGFYAQVEGSELTGYHVLENRKYAGTLGAYFRVKTWKDIGTLNVGGTMFGEHYDHNERGETYGLGGYFSPNAYFLAAVPVTFAGHNGAYFHYSVSGSAGLQTFQEDSQVYFPLDVPIQTGFGSGCGSLTCALYPVNSNTGLNYSLDAQGSYEINEHWYVGGFVSGNNTNNYNTVSGGFFVRFLFRPQYPTAEYPTGLFSFDGFRPVRVP
jgi:tetratricopeptide (TPR) repeat protein